MQEAELDLTALSMDAAVIRREFDRLDRIVDVIQSKEMPPADFEPQPSDNERRLLVNWLKSEIDSIAEAERDDPGIVVMPRLSRHEYRNVMRDLSGGVVTNAGRLMANEGGAGEGFANVGEAQGMSAAQYEKYIEAAKDVLLHLRVYPSRGASFQLANAERQAGSLSHGIVWNPLPREPVDEPQRAIKEATDEIIVWYVAQQQKWGEEHRDRLAQRYGSAHAIYLEAAWRKQHGKPPLNEPLAIVALDKWLDILTSEKSNSPFSDWAKAWRALPADWGDDRIRAECLKIATGQRGGSTEINREDYAPPYEISFHEAREEVLEAANKQGHWPFRIDIGDAKELFLVVTDAGDGGRDEYAVWQKGRFVFKDGTSKPWQETVSIVGANSGRVFDWGLDGEGAKVLGPDAIGVKPPGALKFAVPSDAIVFEVDLTLDHNRSQTASIQSLVLKEKPKSQSYVPGRYVFGGKKRQADAPYHYTATQIRQIATTEDQAILQQLEDRLALIALPPPSETLESQALQALEQFAYRAWRQTLTNDDRELLRRLYRQAATEGLSYDSSVKSPLLAILVSPRFLYRSLERDDESPKAKANLQSGGKSPHSKGVSLSSYSLASRLSFFLWGSIPDDELLRVAAENRLLDREILKAQTRRMLRDQRARSLAIDFAGQLWGFADFEQFSGPDAERFPKFTPELQRAMFDEVVMFLDDLFHNDRPLTLLIDADYTFANELLAKHYELPVARLSESSDYRAHDSESQATALPDGRRGLPGMALFLTKTSLPLRTSAVQRGVWISEQFLGREIPNPPAMVDPISADETDAAGLTTREQLERHRANPSCAACHAKFDPFGVALENFDAIGRWRTTLREGGQLSSTDRMPDGSEIAGADGLTHYLLDHRHEVLDHFTRKLLGYALGRSVQPGDTALLKKLNDNLPEHEYRMSFLIETIVTSPQFMLGRNLDQLAMEATKP